MYPLFVTTVALAAALTFSVQPMLGKMLLPVMGGTPAVWNTAMVFFQVMLLAGYLYAHLSVRWLGPRRQWLAHLLLLAAAAWFLPAEVGAPGDSVLADYPALWVLVTLFAAVGLPFLVVTSTTPLIQRWLAATDHRHARDPYHLYAASNCGSVGALLAYPFLLEPRLALGSQSVVWLTLYLTLGLALAAGAGLMLRRSGGAVPDRGEPQSVAPPRWRDRLRWLVLALIPSSLLLSVTSVITTDLAPMPLLWVVPLSLYLLSHIHAFARHRPVPTQWWLRASALLLVPAAAVFALGFHQPLGVLLVFHLLVLLVVALACHGRLADDRPAPAHLTEFYVWLAVGGAVGGIFNALVAPLLFDRLLEYPLVLALAAAMIATPLWRDRWMGRSLLAGLAVAVVLTAPVLLLASDMNITAAVALLAALLVGGTAVLVLRRAAIAHVAAVGLCAVAVGVSAIGDGDELHAARSFYGTHQVLAEGGDYHVLIHGNTAHGAQEVDRSGPDEALAYYHASGPLGDIFDVVGERAPQGEIGVVGLGSGSMAAHRQPYQRMVFYEIDPAVKRIASTPDYFTYLRNCGQGCEVVLGDGRLAVAAEPAGRFDLIVLDAYSSAAIPVHLLTLEAMELFLGRLAGEGLIALHVSNPYIDLVPVIGRLAEAHGLAVRSRAHDLDDMTATGERLHESEWVVVARDSAALGPLAGDPDWLPVTPMAGPPWRDDFAPLWQAYVASGSRAAPVDP